MSDRGSFCTEYVYCAKCFEGIKNILIAREKYLCSAQVPSWCDEEIPIIAGKIGCLGGGEIREFEAKYRKNIESVICHEIRISILCDDGHNEVLFLRPESWDNA